MRGRRLKLAKFALLTFLNYIAFAFAQSFLVTRLSDLGYSPGERGMIIAFGALFTVLGQFFIGYLCDKLQTNKKVFIVIRIISAIIAWAFYTFGDLGLGIVVLSVLGFTSTGQMMISVMDSWVLESDEFFVNNFGLVRVFGSFGWMLTTYVIGSIIDNYGYAMVGNLILLFSTIVVIYSCFIQDSNKINAGREIKLSDIKIILQDKKFILVVAILAFANLSVSSETYVIIEKMMQLGASNSEIGFKWAYQAALELPMFFMVGYILKRKGYRKILPLVLVLYGIRWVLYGLANSTEQIIWITTMQLITFPFLQVCMKVLVSEVAPKHLFTTSQTLAASIYIGFVTFLSPLLTGVMMDALGLNNTIYIIGAIMIIPLVLFFKFLKLQEVN
ncbi:MAG: MFS transporter [Erysipelotrichaceae bacterium]